MRPRTSIVATLLALAVATLGFGACGQSSPPPGATTTPVAVPQRGGTVVVAASGDVEGWNELLAADNRFTGEILEQLFLRLFAEQPDYEAHPPTLLPQLAERHEWSADHRTLTVHLRPGLTWSDGAPITAEDVRWTWQAQTSPDVAWSYSHVKDAITEVAVVDPLTVRFVFREVYATQLLDANEGAILPKHAWGALPFAKWRENADWFREHLVVSGPFRLEAWRPAEEIVLAPNPRYFEAGRPYLDRVVFRLLPDQANQLAQLQGGTLDFVWGIPPRAAAELTQKPGIEILSFWNRQYDYICWNTKKPLFRDPEVRRALTLAIDRPALVAAIWKGRARPSVGPILSSIWAFDSTLSPWPYDPAEARRILAAKGWADRDGDGVLERGGERFAFELSTNAGNALRRDAAVMIQAQLARIGVAAAPRTLDMGTLTERNMSHDFDATLGGWGIDTSLDLRFAFHSAEIDGGYNFGSYANPEVDRLIDEVRRQSDLAAAKPLFVRLQRILHQEQPYTFLWEPQRLCAKRARLRDARPNALATFFNLSGWWLADAGG